MPVSTDANNPYGPVDVGHAIKQSVRHYPATSSVRVEVTVGLIMLYALLAPLGNLARFGNNEGDYGLTTLVLILAVAINLAPSLWAITSSNLLFSLVVLTAWMAISSLFSDDLTTAYTRLGSFAIYVIFAGLAFSINWSLARIHRLLLVFVLGGLLSSSLTLIDWFGWVDIPRVNELGISTHTDFGDVMQASGAFPRRSAMAAYFALLIPVSVLALIQIRTLSRRTKIMILITAIAASVSLVLTHNRAGLVGALIAIAAIGGSMVRTPRKLLLAAALGLASAILIAWLVVTYLPDQVVAYEAAFRIGTATSTNPTAGESDALRLVFLEYSLKSLLTNPIGHGYTLLTDVASFDKVDPHNMVTQIIWAAGIGGVIWLAYFSGALFVRCRPLFSKSYQDNPFSQYGRVIVGGLLGWFLCGMAHMIIATGMSWLLFGILLRILRGFSRRATYPIVIGGRT